MPIRDVMPVSTWKDLRTVLVSAKTPSEETIVHTVLGKISSASSRVKSVHSFVHLRGAVQYLFMNLELPQKRIIFPRYICGSVVRAAERAGFKPTLCDVDMKSGAISVRELKKMPLKKFGAVFVVHPFGIPAEIKEISELCQKHNIFLIEDCAHTYDRIVDGKMLGTWGDFALFHFAKKFANVHGGMLVSYKFALPELDARAVKPKLSEIFSLFLKLDFLRPIINLFRTMTSVPVHADKDDARMTALRPASRASKRLFIKKLKIHRENKFRLTELIKLYKENLPSSFTALEKQVPPDLFNFPVLCPSGKNRDDIMKKLRVYGIFADRVWYESDNAFANRILNLPINSYMKEHDVKLICNLLKNV